MIPAYTITEAGIDDVGEILSVQKLAFQSEAELLNNFSIPPLLQTLESIKADFHEYRFFKIVTGNRIAGASKVRLIENNMLWIGRVLVHPEFQKRGFGKAMMQFIEMEYCHAAGYELFTAQESVRNIRFYESLGYTVSGTYNEPGHSDIKLVKMQKLNP